MKTFYFERECRTANSECYTILRGETSLGRIDLHYTDAVVHSTLSINKNITTEEIQDLVDTIDEELVNSIGVPKQELIVHVHQGVDLGLFSTRNFEGNGGHERLN
tara:strand:+ start:70 stop:384 length:315 start_codon:yes stop_codon:yes gene_type:complete